MRRGGVFDQGRCGGGAGEVDEAAEGEQVCAAQEEVRGEGHGPPRQGG